MDPIDTRENADKDLSECNFDNFFDDDSQTGKRLSKKFENIND